MKTLHHTETTWQGRKIIIDAADLTAECGYIEVMAMYPDGTEIESCRTHDPEEARRTFNLYCDLAADRPTADTYTRADWERDRSFNARPGQPIAADVYEELFNVLPPYSLPRDLRKVGYNGFLMGEPHSSDSNGTLYMAFVRHGLQHFYYGLVHR